MEISISQDVNDRGVTIYALSYSGSDVETIFFTHGRKFKLKNEPIFSYVGRCIDNQFQLTVFNSERGDKLIRSIYSTIEGGGFTRQVENLSSFLYDDYEETCLPL